MSTVRRGRSRHPGVVLIRPDKDARHTTWRARYRDPDTGKLTKVRIDPLAYPDATSRREWAIRKAREIAKRREALDDGAPRALGNALAATLARYYTAHPQLRPKTLISYKAATAKLETWAKAVGVESADDLNRAKLLDFRAALIAEPKHAPRGGKGTQRAKWTKKTAAKRSAHSVNRELRSVRVVLGYLRDLDLLAHVSHDDLRRGLKRVSVAHERITYLKAHELQKLLAAALRHDAEVYLESREEHAGNRPKGTTPRYEAIAPMLTTAMLTGMRLGEVLALDWRNVDLEALDHDGQVAGEIHLLGAATKTHKARTIGLEVSPMLRKLLAALRLRDGGKGPVWRERKADKDGLPVAITVDQAQAAMKRLVAEYGAPTGSGWQMLRRTCGTYLTNAPGIFGAASAYRSAKQLGHSVLVAEKHYLDVARGIPREARTLEAAMQIEAELAAVIAAVGSSPTSQTKPAGKVAS